MALPLFDRTKGTLAGSSPEKPVIGGGANGTLTPNPKGGLPIFNRTFDEPVAIAEPVPVPPPEPGGNSGTNKFAEGLGLTESDLNRLKPVGSENATAFKAGIGRGLLDMLRRTAGQAVGLVGLGEESRTKGRAALADVYKQIGVADEKNPYKKEPIIDKLVGFDAHAVLGAKAKQLKDYIDTTAAKPIEDMRSRDPYSNTFAGKTGEAVGGIVPQVAFAAARTPTLLLSLSESAMNVEDSYKANIKRGMSEADAMKRAIPQLGADLLGTYLSDKLGKFGSLEKALDGKAFGGLKSVILEYLKDSGLEVGQEVYQQALQNLTEDKPITENLGETAKLTIIPAMLFGLAGPIAGISNERIDEAKTPEQKQVIVDEVKAKIEANPELINDPEIRNIVRPEQEIPTAPTPEQAMSAAEANIANTPAVEPIKTAESTPTEPIKSPDAEKFTSRVFERLQAETPKKLTGDLEAERVNQKKDAEKAIQLIEQDKQKAYDIAIGKETSPDVTSTAVNIALAEKALSEGNNELYAKLTKARSLAQTRRGQEISAEKGSVTDNSTARYVKELLALKLEKLGSNFTSGIKESVAGMKGSKKKRGTNVLEQKVDQLEKKIKSKKIDAKTAISLIEQLKCL